MPTIYMLVGLIGSGKSTWCKEHVKYNQKTMIVCKDHIREMLYGKYNFNINDEALIHNIATLTVSELLYDNYDVIIDETNINKKTRENWFNNIHYKTNIVFVYFPEHGNNLNWRMNSPRGIDRKVWESVLYKMKDKFEHVNEMELKKYNAKLIMVDHKESN